MSQQDARNKCASKLREYRRWRDGDREKAKELADVPGWGFLADKCERDADMWKDIAFGYLQGLIDCGFIKDIWAIMADADKAKEATL